MKIRMLHSKLPLCSRFSSFEVRKARPSSIDFLFKLGGFPWSVQLVYLMCLGLLQWSYQGRFFSPSSYPLVAKVELLVSSILVPLKFHRIIFLLDSSLLTSKNTSYIDDNDFLPQTSSNSRLRPTRYRSKLHDESRLIQGVLMITRMMTKSSKVKITSW